MSAREMSTDELRRALGGGVLTLGIEEILKLLPHRPPVVLVDRVNMLDPGRHAVGTKGVTGSEYGLSKRRHGFVFPASMALEALAQLAALVLLYPENGDLGAVPSGSEDRFGTIAAVRNLTVHREMISPDRIDSHVSIVKSWPPYHRFRGEVSIHGLRFVEATFDLALPATR